MATARFRILQHRTADGPVVPETIGWRLLATNNRDLGRSPTGFPDAGTCRSAIHRLQEQVGRAEPVLTRTGPSSWSWRLTIGDQVVAVASRTYQRRIQAEQAVAVVLGLIPAAVLVGLDQH